ncbi:MAG: AraC family transcriptional regulator [Sphingomonadales bacterium]|nr:MAG: AraC family transcriptional regulator [Sphingomonadales bacterium]
MPVLAFDMTTANFESRRFEFRGKNNADYYEGDLEALSPREVDMKIEKSVSGDYAIYDLSSRTGLAFRRSWAHIRSDKTNVTVFWFVRRGEIAISHSSGRNVIHKNECAITRSSKPFYMELTPDESGMVEAMHVVVPSHRLYSIISDSLEAGRPFPTSQGDLLLAERILTLLFEQGEEIDRDTAEQLVQTLLNGVGRTIARIAGDPAPRSTLADRRVADITRYIEQHFANPDLNAKLVADSCGISLRYLCHILKKHDLSFSQLLWDRRMGTAQSWLHAEKMRHLAISEIAYLAGFKSSAHFSRMFKARYGMGPRDYRALPVPQGNA